MKLYLNALGIVTPLGVGKESVAINLFAGSRSGLIERHDIVPDRPARVGAVEMDLPLIPDSLRDFDCRNNRLALAALQEIEPDVTTAIRRYGKDRIAVIVGTSTSGLAEGEEALAIRLRQGSWPPDFRYSQQELGNVAEFVARVLGVDGPAYTVATACSSSGKAFASAQRLLEAGLCDAAIVGGVDALCRMTVNGFHALESLAVGYCQPFSRNRDGINVGEGAAIFLVSREPGPVLLLGVGESSDAHHISAPDPQGTGAIRAMQLALNTASIPPSAIDYVNLHGTGTRLNDHMEGHAIARMFGTGIFCSSTKSMSGHMLGAAGAGEAAFLWLALNPEFSQGRLPPHVWDGAADPEIPALNLVSIGTRTGLKTQTAMLSNSFAFGGSNVALVLGRGW